MITLSLIVGEIWKKRIQNVRRAATKKVNQRVESLRTQEIRKEIIKEGESERKEKRT